MVQFYIFLGMGNYRNTLAELYLDWGKGGGGTKGRKDKGEKGRRGKIERRSKTF